MSPSMGQSIEMSRSQQLVGRLSRAITRMRRKLPHLVWYDDEVDVTVTLKDLGALGGDPSRVFEAQALLRDMGIGFDSGSGAHGRDWEWDWSLSGPISIQFRGRAKRPERRTAKTKPKLVVDNCA